MGKPVILVNHDVLYEGLYGVLKQDFSAWGDKNFVEVELGTQRVKSLHHVDFRWVIMEPCRGFGSFLHLLKSIYTNQYVVAVMENENILVYLLSLRFSNWEFFAQKTVTFTYKSAVRVLHRNSGRLIKWPRNLCLVYPWWRLRISAFNRKRVLMCNTNTPMSLAVVTWTLNSSRLWCSEWQSG